MAKSKERREAGAAAKFRLLMWKNFLIQWRHPIQTAAELLVPVLALSLILVLRSQVDPEPREQVWYPPVQADTLLPSTFSLLVIQGMNRTKLSMAYSPENPVLENVLREAISKLFVKNALNLGGAAVPILIEAFPELADFLLRPINVTAIQETVAQNIRLEGYNRSEQLDGIYSNEEATREVMAAVEFPDDWREATQLPENMSYSLRFPMAPRLSSFLGLGASRWRVTSTFPFSSDAGPRSPDRPEGGNDPGYMNELFIALQHSISMEMIYRVTEQDFSNWNVLVQRYPHPAYIRDQGVQMLKLTLSMVVLLSFSYTAINIVRSITLEKELQLKEAMKIMGLPTWLHWTAWFCKQFLYLLIIAVLVVILLKVNWFETEEGFSDYAVFTHTPWHVLLFFLLLYLTCTIFLCFMLSAFFATANTAALFTGVFWFLLYIPAFLVSTVADGSVSLAGQLAICLSVNSAMAYGFQVMLDEDAMGGLQWGKFFSSGTATPERLGFGHVVAMLVLDCVLYFLVALYLEQVVPGPYGSPRPWYFLVQKEFWFENNSKLEGNAMELDKDDDGEDAPKEEDPKGLSVGVKIANLTKVFGNNTAVNNLSLNIYDDQITVLLGHNGAGKSTTISILTGNLPASSGSVWVAGYDIQRQGRAARAHLGFCPQHNVLFPELTVREHLEFFSRLKGLTGPDLLNDIDELIHKLELQDKSDYQSKGLSGGQKRRLSVGIALCGNARVVLLDEPTSGMDPASRRALWTLLQREKSGRSMILTTHFMDEADYLGERVAIMAGGRLQCLGSPYFLKRHYGVGYTLVVVKTDAFHEDLCTHVIQKYIPGICVKEDRGMEVTYSLSNEYSSVFEAILKELEDNSGGIGFSNYGLSATTMEDVFMSAGSDVGAQHFDADDETATTATDLSSEDLRHDGELSTDEFVNVAEERVTGARLLWQHTVATWLKLWLVWTRSRGVLLLLILVPLILFNAGLGVYTYVLNTSQLFFPRALTLDQGFSYTETYLSYNGSGAAGAAAADAYRGLFPSPRTALVDLRDGAPAEYYMAQTEDPKRLYDMRTQVLIGATFGDETAIAWFSNFGYHDVAISMATLHRALLKSVLPNAELNVSNYPIEVNYETNNNLALIATYLTMQLVSSIGHSLAIMAAVFIMFYVKERVSRAKLLQKASGIEPAVLWGSAALFDWLFFSLICIIFLVSCLAFNVTGMNTFHELGRLYLVVLVYGAAMLPLNYILSYLFSGATFGFVVVFFANVLLGLLGQNIVSSLWTLGSAGAVPDVMDAVLQFYPLYSAVTAVMNIHSISMREWTCLQLCSVLPSSDRVCTMETICQTLNQTACCVRENRYFEWEQPGILRYLACMAGSCLVFWIILMCAEYRLHRKVSWWRRRRVPPADAGGAGVSAPLDEDVASEAEHVRHIAGPALAKHNLVAKSLTKYYDKHLAVNQVSFSVSETECFGLLGVNGAGKSSTFKMLMGDERVSAGDAYVRGHSVSTDIRRVHENIGYCPQFDAVFEELTGRETLRLFAALRGLRAAAAAASALAVAHTLGFTKHLDKRVHQYSGGNKRKLSTAIALLGHARMIFLDEPTTGVDPAAKRQVWRAVRRASAAARSVLLTSHSMEECEALCTRLTIMVNGQFTCLGTPQHLKNKFSQGFTLTIKMKSESESLSRHTVDLKTYVNSSFVSPKLMEEYDGLLTYYLPNRGMAWSQMFGVMERARQIHPIEDYTIAQTTLEQIFLQFTKYQREADAV